MLNVIIHNTHNTFMCVCVYIHNVIFCISVLCLLLKFFWKYAIYFKKNTEQDRWKFQWKCIPENFITVLQTHTLTLPFRIPLRSDPEAKIDLSLNAASVSCQLFNWGQVTESHRASVSLPIKWNNDYLTGLSKGLNKMVNSRCHHAGQTTCRLLHFRAEFLCPWEILS